MTQTDAPFASPSPGCPAVPPALATYIRREIHLQKYNLYFKCASKDGLNKLEIVESSGVRLSSF
jgi:hypothetical protein